MISISDLVNLSKRLDKNQYLSRNRIQSYVIDIYSPFFWGIISTFISSSFISKNLLRNRWQPYLLKLGIALGLNLLCFCLIFRLLFSCTGPLCLPVKRQWSLTLLIFFSQNQQMVLFLYCSPSSSLNIISLLVFYGRRNSFSNFINSFAN